MEQKPSDRRHAPRFPIQAAVIVRKKNGDRLAAQAVNISSSGVSLRMVRPHSFVLGEDVVVEIDLPDHPDKTLPVWGVGRVVRLDAQGPAVRLQAGGFADVLVREAEDSRSETRVPNDEE